MKTENNYSIMAPGIAYSKPENFSRAAVMYLPNQEPYDNYKAHDFEQQLRWFRGWQEMLKYQPPKWKTDIIIVTEATTSTSPTLDVFHSWRVGKSRCRIPPTCCQSKSSGPVKVNKTALHVLRLRFGEQLLACQVNQLF